MAQNVRDDTLAEFNSVALAEAPHRRHAVAASVAAIVSLGLHAFLLYGVSHFDLDFIATVARVTEQEQLRKPITLRDVELGDTRPDAPDAADASAGDGVMTDLSREIEILRKDPDEVVMQPPSVTPVELSGDSATVAEPSDVPRRSTWEPRQEIMSIRREVVADELPTLERRRIPRIERIAQAPDVVLPVDWEKLIRTRPQLDDGEGPTGRPVAAEIAPPDAEGSVAEAEPEVVVGEGATEDSPSLFEETAEEISPFTAIENLLTAELRTFRSARDDGFGYFRIDIQRRGADLLPVIPKDIVLVQDCSASMAEQRLYFCREGLRRCLAAIGPDDRFNIIAFRSQTERCFEGWARNTPTRLTQAESFIDALRSGGNTDIYGSMKDVLQFDRTPGRPVIALVITDGLSTSGMTQSSDIIGEFTRANDGDVSVFAIGTMQRANAYLLDLLSYCNRGDAKVITSGRWDIPEEMEGSMDGVSRPVLEDVRLRFGATTACEVYPVLTPNLYLDRSLAIYGRYPLDTERVTFQAVGEAGDATCDMVFDLPLGEGALRSDDDLRTRWAEQKIYHLMGSYARDPDAVTREAIRETARRYRIPVPYRGRF